MLLLSALALALPAPHLSHEPLPVLAPGWRIVGAPAPTERIELTFALKQQNLDQLHDTLMAVSTPTSERYGKHLTNEAVHALVAPAAADVATVRNFLDAHEVKSATPNDDMLTVTTTFGAAERLLNAEYVTLEHTSGSRVHRAALSGYSIPANVAAAIDFVSPTVHVPGVRASAKAMVEAKADSPSFNENEPTTLRTLYSIPLATAGKAKANKMAVTAFLGQEYDQGDLKQYWSKYCKNFECGDGMPKLVGDATTGHAGVEAMLDIETITGVAGGIEAEFWGFAGKSPDNPANEPFMKWLSTVSSTSDADIPKLFSTSYGEDESSWSLGAATRLNAEFMKAGARGISLLYASGDEGANCKGGSKFVPEGPGSSPYVTAVGGTGPTSGFPKPGSEQAIGLSSGGFSSYWPMPSWQHDAVTTYLQTTEKLPPASRGYNTSGRAYPDIAAQATDFCVTPFGCGVAGTSCASPTAAGVFALLNDVRLAAGKSSLGFLNPLIYSNMASFQDITEGSNNGCGFVGGGWPANKGWDAVTGVGTPNYAKLAAVVAALP